MNLCTNTNVHTAFPFECSGLLIAVQKDYFTVVNYKELHFNDCSDRVAQLLHVELAFPLSQCQESDVRHEILIVNTHLLFPHDSSLCLVRLHQVCEHLVLVFKHHLLLRLASHFVFQNFAFLQVYQILQYLESYQNEHQLKPLPILLCG